MFVWVTVAEADAGRVLGSLEAAMPKGRKGRPAHFYHKNSGDVPSVLTEIGGHVPKWSPTPVPPSLAGA